MLGEPAAGDEGRLGRAFQLAVARAPREAERGGLRTLLAAQREHYRAQPEEARKLLGVGFAPAPAGDVAEHAAWTQVARVILNLQETITRY